MKFIRNIFLCLLTGSALSAGAQVPTWADNIACIAYSRCTGCHHAGGIAPFSMVDYNTTVPFSATIQFMVNGGHMPPWPPDPGYQTYAHERVLTQQEIDLINDWVNNGSPQGNPANTPAPPVYNGNAQITNPDLTVAMPVYTVPAVGFDLYRCFAIPDVNQTEQFITGIEVLPGNSNIVHHVLVYADTAGTCLTLDSLDPGPGYTSFGGVGSGTASLIGAWVPGSQPFFLPATMGIRLPEHANIIMQVHYPAGSGGQTDSTRLNMLLNSSPATRDVYIVPVLNHSTNLVNGPLFIPADSIKTFYAQQLTPINVTMLAVAPHMHLIGKSISSWAVTLLNDTIRLIDIPEWDFHWQGAYSFRKPLKVPAGSTFYSAATYDNTTGNPNNPSNPPIDVSLGEATTDEMMLIYFYFLAYQPGDENIIIDTSTVVNTYNNCSFALGAGSSLQPAQPVQVYPNPVSDWMNVYLPVNHHYHLTVYDLSGRILATHKKSFSTVRFDCSGWQPGSYILRAVSGEETIHRIFSVAH